MRINTRFAVAVHILALIQLNRGQSVTSEKMAVSVGTNPVVIRQVMSVLKKAGLIETQSGVPGGRLAKPQEEITFLEIYRAVKSKSDTSLFDLHQNPNSACPVGRNIKNALETPLCSAEAAMENELANCTLRDVTAYIVDKET